jgi:hypothetical protein
LFLIAVLASATYAAYFYVRGASYHQWKLATYLPLMLSFAWWAACVSIMRATMKSRTLAALATPSLCALLLIGNLLSYALREPPMWTFPASYANLRSLDVTGTWTDLYVRMSSYAATFFPVYFIRHKTLHLLSDSYYPKEQFELGSISPTRPLFVEGRVQPETHGRPLSGCWLSVSAVPDDRICSNYSLSTQLPISIEAKASHQEAGGVERWRQDTFNCSLQARNFSAERFVVFKIYPYMGRRTASVNHTRRVARGDVTTSLEPLAYHVRDD